MKRVLLVSLSVPLALVACSIEANFEGTGSPTRAAGDGGLGSEVEAGSSGDASAEAGSIDWRLIFDSRQPRERTADRDGRRGSHSGHGVRRPEAAAARGPAVAGRHRACTVDRAHRAVMTLKQGDQRPR
jgi:hypothetical protein